ncbi:unnamed protein product [Parajaminaea phylloscopi]
MKHEPEHEPAEPLPIADQSNPHVPLGSPHAGRRPITCGLFFSLGHSTIVFAVTVAVSISISVASRLDGVGGVGGIIGQSVSGSFLMLVAIINTCILASTIRARKRDRQRAEESSQQRSKAGDGDASEAVSANAASGQPRRVWTIFTRLVAPLLRLVTQPYHMYPIGVLFGLGFDTASTIALLSISAVAGNPHWARESDLSGSEAQAEAKHWRGGDAKVILLALLFTAGMTFVDSCDSVLMVYAYAPPLREPGSNQKWWSLWEQTRPDCGPAAGTSRRPAGGSAMDSPSPPSRAIPHDAHDSQAEEACADPQYEGKVDDVVLARPGDLEKAEAPHENTTAPQLTEPPIAATAQTLSLLLTSLSIILAFAISCIVLMSLIASQCGPCSAAAKAHDDYSAAEAPMTMSGGRDGDDDDDGGLAGRWWSFWLKAGDASGYIGAGIVAVFLVCGLGWWLTRACKGRRRRRLRRQRQKT